MDPLGFQHPQGSLHLTVIPVPRIPGFTSSPGLLGHLPQTWYAYIMQAKYSYTCFFKKTRLGRKVLISSYRLHIVCHEGSQGRNWEQKSRRNIVYWLVAQIISSYLPTAQSHLPKDDTTHTGLGSPTPIANEENDS